MKNDHPEITTLPYELNDGDTIQYPIVAMDTERLMNVLLYLDSWDYDYVLPIMAELCERCGLDLADYNDCDECYNAVLNTL